MENISFKLFTYSFMDNLWKVLPDCSNVEAGELSVREASDLGAYKALESVTYMIDSLQQEQPIKVNTLTWKDINDLERIINNVHYEFRNGIGEKSFGEEVLERFMEERDEQEQPEVDLEKEIRDTCRGYRINDHYEQELGKQDIDNIARYFYELGLNARNE